MNSEHLLHHKVSRLYLHYLFPTLLAMASNSLYCLADVYFVSIGAGSTGLAAMNIAMPVFMIYSAIGLTFGVGGATIMSIAEGNKNTLLRNQAFSLSMVLNISIGLIVAILGTMFADTFAYALGSSEALLLDVKQYLIPVNMGAFVFVLNYAGAVLLRNDHAPKLAMIATITGNLSNVVLDYIFVIVLKQGLQGAAIVTVLGTLISVLCMSIHFIRKQHTVHFQWNCMKVSLIKRMCMNGSGSGILELSAGIVILVFNFVILQYADEQFLASFAIVTNIAFVLKGLLNGFAQAAQPIISTNYGANNKIRAQEAFFVSLWYSGLFSLCIYILCLLFPKEVASIFANQDQELIILAGKGIMYYFSGLVSTALLTMYLYYFQSIESGRIATILAVCKGFIFVLLFLWGLLWLFGVSAIWFCVPLAETITLFIAWWIRKRGMKNE